MYAFIAADFVNFCIFLATIVKVWRLLTHHSYLRKNEPSMILKAIISVL
jgi:hypothetical protein